MPAALVCPFFGFDTDLPPTVYYCLTRCVAMAPGMVCDYGAWKGASGATQRLDQVPCPLASCHTFEDSSLESRWEA